MMKTFSDSYPVWFCDIWGVVHNGVAPFPVTVAALKRHREAGGTVILVTNSPRSNVGVEKQLLEIGVDPASHDRIVTSGDVTQVLMKLHGGGKVFHLGAARDHSIYDGTGVERVSLDQAQAVLCTGLFDDLNDTLEDYEPLLDDLKRRGLSMICANPDKIVKKGDRILFCAASPSPRSMTLPWLRRSASPRATSTGPTSWPSATGRRPTSVARPTMALTHFLLQKG